MANSGLIDFVFAVTQTLFGGVRVFDNQQHQTAPAMEIGGVAHQLAALYGAWRSGALWAGKRVRPLRHELEPSVAPLAELLGRMCMMFVLAHEAGHVARARLDAQPGVTVAAALTREQELLADTEAASMLFAHGREWGSPRLAVAGGVVMLRILSGLGKLGHRFPGAHPPPSVRLANLWTAIRTMSGTEDEYWYLTTIAYAFDEHLEAAENLLRGRASTTRLTAPRMFSRLGAALEEGVRGGQSMEGVMEALTADMREARPPVLREVADTAARVLRPLPAVSIAAGEVPMRHRVATLFLELMPDYPARARAAFTAALDRQANEEEKRGDHRLP